MSHDPKPSRSENPLDVKAAPLDPAEAYRVRRRAHWDSLAREMEGRSPTGIYYHQRLRQIFTHLVPPGLRVLELGCGQGDLLAAVRPSRGVGVDFSGQMLRRARQRHSGLTFLEQDIHDLSVPETFDVIILSDLVNDLWDVQAAFERLRLACLPDTRIILNTYSRLWEGPLAVAERLGVAKPVLRQNWLTLHDLTNLLDLAGFEPLRSFQEVLWPIRTPLLAPLCNRTLVKLPFLRHLALTNFLVARPKNRPSGPTAPSVSIVVPARNEAGNIPAILARTPAFPGPSEILFVEGHSSDDTYSAIERAIAEHPARHCKLLKQSGTGKGDAVRLGFSNATGDVLIILDADLTVPPEELPRFYDALVTGTGEFINGVRLVYPMENEAMRFFNLFGNHFFAHSFSWLLGQAIKDTLCGTKVLWRRHYDRIAANRSYFGEFDPFGDFDLLFGAARLNLKLVDLPVRYRARSYGTTNIRRFRHGLLLLRMLFVAARRLKFV
jgi:SAM-dependent methyltransferase